MRPDYPALLQTLSQAVASDFYDPYLHGVDWPAISRDYRARAGSIHNDRDFQRLATAMLATLHASHTDVRPPRGDLPWASPALRLDSEGDGAMITDVAALSDARAHGLRPGYRLRGTQHLAGPLGSSLRLSYQDCAGRQRQASVRRESAYWPPALPGFHWSSIQLDPHTRYGYLRVDAFEDDGAELADQAMSALADTQGLVIDLRGNDGGNASAVRLASYFVSKPGAAVILLDRDYLQALGHSPSRAEVLAAPRADRIYTSDQVGAALGAHHGAIALWTEDMGAKRYTRPVVLLIGPNTASAAEGFAWIMKLRSDATLIGQATAGALLSAQRIELGQGWSARIPTAGVWAPDGEDYGDKAVPPDRLVKPDAASLCAGRDAALEAAFATLRAKAARDSPH